MTGTGEVRASSARRGGRIETALAVLLAVVAYAAAVDHQRDDSPTLDEPFHVMAGAEYVRNGTYELNLEHPPLVKDLAGLALAPLKLEPPPPGARVPSSNDDYSRWLYANRAPAHVIVQYGRRPFPFVLAALALAVFLAGRALWGPPAGLLACALVALDPTCVGHGALVHTDVGAALTVTATLAAAVLACERASLPAWLGAGALLGVALATKFSCVLLVPVLLALPLLALWRLPGAAPLRRQLPGLALAFLAAGAVLLAIYAVNLRNATRDDAASAAVAFLRGRGASEATLASQARLSKAFPALGHYVAGLRGVSLLDSGGRGANYLMGRISQDRFLLYFPVAFLVKSTPALLALAALLAVLGRRELASFRALCLLLAAALFFAAAVRSRFNIGVRHVLPVTPLLALAGAGVLSRRLSPRAFRAVGAALAASCAFSLWRAHPEEIAYFNVLGGGEERRRWLLTDSNIDWGQDLKRLGDELRRTGHEADTTVVAYSGVATNYFMPRCKVLVPGEPIRPGLYAVSAIIEAIGPDFVSTFEGEESARQVRELNERLKRSGRRTGWVGGSIGLWELP